MDMILAKPNNDVILNRMLDYYTDLKLRTPWNNNKNIAMHSKPFTLF